MMRNDRLGLYVHIPFCVRKCLYCDFLSHTATEKAIKKYCQTLVQEMVLWGGEQHIQGREVDTVFVGGGTPSLLSVEDIAPVLKGIYDNFSLAEDVEFTLECNPGTVTKEKLHCYRHYGVNRLSIGLQSANNRELEELGRIHTWEQFKETFTMAREVHFNNINIDVMAAIPEQTVESYDTTLQHVIDLEPEHISAYSLIIEEGTPYYERYAANPPVSEETDRHMYQLTGEKLAGAGYERYEISNYARDGYMCRHNVKYWRREAYLGLGPGAASFLYFDGVPVRFSNTRELEDYERQVKVGKMPIAEKETLATEEEMAEFMFLGLRCTKGVSKREFEAYFHKKMKDVYGNVIDELKGMDLLAEDRDCIALTSKGIDVSNVIFAKFI